MEVSFLSSTGSFGGVEYNLSKVMKNAAELLDVANFEGLMHISNPTIGEYTSYLRAWSERNSRIKNSQFHVAISCKGQEKSKEELLGVAKQWLKEMGYDGIPALFIFHHDTDNNHLHIITSRVDKNGRKVNDSNERWRGRAILKRLEGVRMSLEEEAKKAIEEALTYRFFNNKQFYLILESKGYKIDERRDGYVEVRKYGKLVWGIQKAEIDDAICSKKKESDNSREKQLKAILSKYKDQMPLAELKDLMRKSFGVELVFFGKTGKPYGYAIIDHKDKYVYKGGDIMPLKDLLGEKKKEEIDHKQRAEKFVSLILEGGNPTIKEVNALLRKYGYSLRKDTLYHYGKEIGKLSSMSVEQIKYNDRLERTKRIKTDDPKIIDALARHFNVKREDLSISESSNKVTNMGYNSLQELYDQAFLSGEFLYYLKLHNAFLFKDEGKTYLVEQETGSIAEIKTNNLERDLISEMQSVGEEPTSSIGLDEVANILGVGQSGASSANNELPKRKRKR